jgi:predicted Zn-dependent protease
MLQFRRWSKRPGKGRPGRSSRIGLLGLESLEGRMLLATAGYDYVLSGYDWSNPSHITYSVAPDGMYWSHGANNLNATLNPKLGYGTWQREFALALANWESMANINIAQVADSARSLGFPGNSQGDPRFGDIRLGGYNFAAGSDSTLAQTYFPPPQGTTEAGDLEVNTNQNFTNGAAGYDFFSVMLHETGHALGLDHSPNPDTVMYFQYRGVKTGLQPGDIAGIQAIYGPRTLDSYQSQGRGVDWGSAIDVTASLGASRQTALGNVALATIGDTEYFTVVAPSNPGASLQITAAASNVSLLSPKLSLFDASGTLLDTAANSSAWGNTVTVNTSQVVPGRRYYVAVTGATNDAFAVGAYQLQVAFAEGAPSGSPPSPPPQLVSPGPSHPSPPPLHTIGPDRFEPNNSFAQATKLGLVSTTVTAGNLTLDSAGDVDNFNFRNGKAGIYQVGAGGSMIRVFDGFGRQLAVGADNVSIRVFRPRTSLFVQISSPSGTPLANYSLTVSALNARAKAPNVTRAKAPHRQVSHWPVRP